MMKNGTNITAFILAGGKSSRMGKDKGLILFKEKLLIQHTIDKLKGICDNIVINSNNPQYKSLGYPVIEDIIKDVGPLGGLFSCLSVTNTKYNIMLPCDMPFIDVSLIKLLIKNKEKAPIVMPQHADGKLEPILAIFQSSVLNLIEKNIRERKYKITLLLKESEHFLIQLHKFFSNDYRFHLMNINTIKDLDYETVF